LNKNSDLRNSVAVIILAAGTSSRMGQPKQLLSYRGETLISYVIKCAIASSANLVITILGANGDRIEDNIGSFPITILKNNVWNEGISSSIRCGISYVEKYFSEIEAVIFLTCDQPFISTNLIDKIIDCYDADSQPIIASQYATTIGIPVLFPRILFPEIIQLKGDRGAKKIIERYRDRLKTIYFSRGEIDLDTFEDYQNFLETFL